MPTVPKTESTLTRRQRARRHASNAKAARQAANPLRRLQSCKKLFDGMLSDLTDSPIGTLGSHEKRPVDANRIGVPWVETTSDAVPPLGVLQKVRRAPQDLSLETTTVTDVPALSILDRVDISQAVLVPQAFI